MELSLKVYRSAFNDSSLSLKVYRKKKKFNDNERQIRSTKEEIKIRD